MRTPTKQTIRQGTSNSRQPQFDKDMHNALSFLSIFQLECPITSNEGRSIKRIHFKSINKFKGQSKNCLMLIGKGRIW